ncbi:ATP-binding protein [Roseivivax sp. CAU 1753]
MSRPPESPGSDCTASGRKLRYTLDPGMGDVSRTCVQIESDLVAAGVPPENAVRMALICAEALNNIVEHAHADREGGWIRVAVRTDTPCQITFRDNGAPITDGILPQGRPAMPGQSTQSLPEGGFGWLLIRSLSSDLDYSHEDGENTLRVTLR